MTAISQLLPLLVDGYADKCKELGIIKRSREIKTPEDLMLLCLYHLGNGCSLVDISAVANQFVRKRTPLRSRSRPPFLAEPAVEDCQYKRCCLYEEICSVFRMV